MFEQPGGIRGQQPLTVLAIDADVTEGDALLGTDFTFFTAFLREHFFTHLTNIY